MVALALGTRRPVEQLRRAARRARRSADKTATSTIPTRGQNSFDPRATLSYRFDNGVVLYASGYRSFRAPTLNELYRSFRVGNVQTLANPYLVAEHFTGFETGVRASLLHDRLQVNGTFFWGYVTTPIANVTLVVTDALILRQRQNLGEIRAPGFQVGANLRVTRHNAILRGRISSSTRR